MKANELRIGNWYNSVKFNMPVRCELADLYDLCAKSDGAYNDPPIEDMFEPFPLTEVWLIKFGFIKRDGNNICWDLDKFMIGWYGNRYATWVIGFKQENNELHFHSQIQYVHQLQNLYFALTGEEL